MLSSPDDRQRFLDAPASPHAFVWLDAEGCACPPEQASMVRLAKSVGSGLLCIRIDPGELAAYAPDGVAGRRLR